MHVAEHLGLSILEAHCGCPVGPLALVFGVPAHLGRCNGTPDSVVTGSNNVFCQFVRCDHTPASFIWWCLLQVLRFPDCCQAALHAQLCRDPHRSGQWLPGWGAVSGPPVLCCAALCCAVLCCAVLGSLLCCVRLVALAAELRCAVLCCAVLCCAVLCCAVPCCAVPCCAVLHCARLMAMAAGLELMCVHLTASV